MQGKIGFVATQLTGLIIHCDDVPKIYRLTKPPRPWQSPVGRKLFSPESIPNESQARMSGLPHSRRIIIQKNNLARSFIMT